MNINSIIRPVIWLVKLLSILCFLILTSGSFYLYFYGEDLLKQLTPKIEAELGKSLSAQIMISDLDLKLFPRAGLSMKAISIRPENSCGKIVVKKGSLYIDLLALLRGKYVINHLSLGSAQASVLIENNKVSLVGENDCIVSPSEASADIAEVKKDDINLFLDLKELELEDIHLAIKSESQHQLLISHLNGGVLLSDGVLNLKNPALSATFDSIPVSLKAHAAGINLNAPKLDIDTAAILVGTQSAQISGSIESLQSFENVKIQATEIDLSKISDLLVSIGVEIPKISTGKLNLSTTLSSSLEKGFELNGNMLIRDVKIESLQLQLAEFKLDSLNLKKPLNSALEGASSATLKQLSISHSNNSYQIPSLSAVFFVNAERIAAQNAMIDANINNTTLSLKADKLALARDNSIIEIANAGLSIGASRINVSGKVSPDLKFDNFKFEGATLQLSDLQKFALSFGIKIPEIRSGQASLTMLANTSQTNALSVKGSSEISNLDIPSLKLTLGKLVLGAFSYERLLDSFISECPNFSMSVASIVDGENAYRVSKVEGPIKYSKNKNAGNLTGKFVVEGFGFKDSLTELKNVSAVLSDIKGVIGQKGESIFNTNLTANSLELLNPEIEIKKISNVTAPIKIAVAKNGAYSVSGVVTSKGGQYIVSGRDFSDVNGSVRMLISSANKEFEARPITASILSRKLSTNGLFSMRPDAYRFAGFQADLNKGQIKIDGNLSRTASKTFSADMTLINVPASDLLTLAKGVEDDSFNGEVGRLQAKLSGSTINFLDTLAATGSFELVATKIKGFDLTTAIGQALRAIPFANLKLSTDKLKDDGKSKTAQADFAIAKKVINLSKVKIFRPKYTVQGSGTLNFDLDLDAKASVIFVQETLQALGGGFDRLGRLMGRIGKVEIPIFLKGRIPDISISPDLATLARDNSGITLVGDVLGATYDAGRAVTDFVLSPFGSKKDKREGALPTPTPPI